METIGNFLRDNKTEIESKRYFTWDASKRIRVELVLPIIAHPDTSSFVETLRPSRYGLRDEGLQVFVDDKEIINRSLNTSLISNVYCEELNDGESLAVDDEYREKSCLNDEKISSVVLSIFIADKKWVNRFLTEYSSDIGLLDRLTHKSLETASEDMCSLISENASERLLEAADNVPYSSMIDFLEAWHPNLWSIFDHFDDSPQHDEGCIDAVNDALAEIKKASA